MWPAVHPGTVVALLELGPVAEPVDATDLKSVARKGVSVRLGPGPPCGGQETWPAAYPSLDCCRHGKPARSQASTTFSRALRTPFVALRVSTTSFDHPTSAS